MAPPAQVRCILLVRERARASFVGLAGPRPTLFFFAYDSTSSFFGRFRSCGPVVIRKRMATEGIFQFHVKLLVPKKHVVDLPLSCSLYASTKSTASGATERTFSGDSPDARRFFRPCARRRGLRGWHSRVTAGGLSTDTLKAETGKQGNSRRFGKVFVSIAQKWPCVSTG